MSLRTLERDAPSLFKHGPKATTRVLLLSALAVMLMLADVRYKITEPVRQAVSAVLFPLQWVVMQPVGWIERAQGYFHDLDEAQQQAMEARRLMTEMTVQAHDAGRLLEENQQLRNLLELRPRLVVPSVAAEVMYETPDSYTRRVVLDKGQVAGIAPGSPVMDDLGVLGQVTRVQPFSSEVTLLSDRDQAIPVMVARSGLRSLAYGDASNCGSGAAQPVAFHAHLLRARRTLGWCTACGGAHAAVGAQSCGSARCRADGHFRGRCQSRARGQIGRTPGHTQQTPRACRPRSDPMIMPRGQQLLMPVRPAFIALSVAVVFLLSLLPLGAFVWTPDVLMLVLAFWAMHHPNRMPMSVGFLLGLGVDVQQTALLGQHALTYVLVIYGAQRFSRRMMWFSPLTQALQLLPVFVMAHVLQMLIRMLAGGMFPGFAIALAPVLEMLLWPLVCAVLLAPQRRAPDADSNRPL
jgi:rod shape-determining protein MreD